MKNSSLKNCSSKINGASKMEIIENLKFLICTFSNIFLKLREDYLIVNMTIYL